MATRTLHGTIGNLGWAASILALCVFGGLAIVWCPIPWSTVLLIAAALMIVLALRSRRQIVILMLLNGAAVPAALAAFEAYIGIEQRHGDGTRVEGSLWLGTRRDDLLGYAPRKNSRLSARKLYGDTVLYDVTYSTDADGLRIAPPHNEAGLAGCLIFFGDSYSFGEGVEDTQAFPYVVGQKTKGRYSIYNFAYIGYGPHQMLANLRAGRIDSVVHCNPTHFIYLALPDHIRRAAGLVPWDRHGPRFTLSASGAAIRDGNFDDVYPLFGSQHLSNWVDMAIGQFFTWQRFFGRARDPNAADLALLLAIVRDSAAYINVHYPRSEFHVILRDDGDDPRIAVIEQNAKESGIPVHRITSIIPDYATNWRQYALSIHDHHPNPLMHERIAEYIVQHILDSTK